MATKNICQDKRNLLLGQIFYFCTIAGLIG